MPPPIDTSDEKRVCQWINQGEALAWFATWDGQTQSQQHIKPVHWYVACRLVLEGGFDPEDITPRPPFTVIRRRGQFLLEYDPGVATGSEATILGGLKTKNVDVVVNKDGLGPVLAVSCKGMTGAFRNLTNRMEETIGECTNLHITYPALVFGYIFVIRANRSTEAAISEIVPESAPAARQLAANDIAIAEGGAPVESIVRFHAALRELTGRRGIRNDVSRYESISLALIDTLDAAAGNVLPVFPPVDSPLRLERFFQTLYVRYDERYVYSAPDLSSVTRRLLWSPTSQALRADAGQTLDYEVRLAGDEA
jgi:hypothetical protein